MGACAAPLAAACLLATGCAATLPHATRPLADRAPADSLALADEAVRRGREAQGAADLEVARTEYALALGIRERHLPAGAASTERTRVLLAAAIADAGDYAGGLVLLERTIETLDAAAVRDSQALGEALNARGRVEFLVGNLDASRRTLERAVAVREAHHGPTSTEVRISLNNLATNLARGGKLAEARPYFERLVAAEEAAPRTTDMQLGIYLQNLANVVSDLGEYEQGRVLYERALAIRERVHGPRNLRVAMTLHNIASLHEVTGNDSASLETLTRAIGILDESVGREHPQTFESITSRAAVRRRLGDARGAFEDGLLGERLRREPLRHTSRSLAESQALEYEASRLSGLEVALAVLTDASPAPGMVAAALDAIVRSRAVLLDEMAARRRRVADARDTTVARLEAEWGAAREQLSELALARERVAAQEGYRARIEAAREDARRAEAALAQRSAASRHDQQLARVGLDEVRDALPADAALVSVVRFVAPGLRVAAEGHPRYVAFVTRAGDPPVAISLGDGAGIDSLVGAWRASVMREGGTRADERAALAACRAAGEALRARVWDPLQPVIAGARRVFVVPDGALHLVNLVALPRGRDRWVLDDDVLVHQLSTERDLVRDAEATARGGLMLAMGGADFHAASPPPTASPTNEDVAVVYRGAAPDCESVRQREFPPLAGSAREAREVAALWERNAREAPAARAIVRLGPEATEAEFKRVAPRCRAIHVATHGFFVDERCLARAGDDEDGAWAENPLLYSGLVLAGAGGDTERGMDGEDGFLTAEEIATLNLHEARWVVLSACGTGVGTVVTDEGVFGLRRAFETAGAGTLITSLWNVGDRATRRWMEALYRSRTTGEGSSAEAVRAASRALLAELRASGAVASPREWGAFIASGDWR
jgi:CHAT domain-containing protein/tetratricopeptide (TPR) repeat protein